MKDYLTRAILKLKPTAEFSFIEDDYSTIIWNVLEGSAPSQIEIDAAIKEVKQDEIAEIEAEAKAKAALFTKLGITAEEAKLLLA